MNNKFKEFWSYILIIVIVLIIRTFIVSPVRVDGNSMFTTLKNGEILLLKKYDKKIKRFDIVVFKNGSDKLIKRVIGLPGEHVAYKDNKLYINGELVEDVKLLTKTGDFELENLNVSVIPDNYYFVLGDNRTNSTDSRIIGTIPFKNIKGTTNFTIYPLDRFGKKNVVYSRDDDKHFTVTASIEVSDPFFGWVCGFGNRIKILYPSLVVEDFKNYLDKMRGIYKGDG